MNLMRVLRRLARPIALILALLMSFTLFGCTASEIGDILDIAGDVIELLDDSSANTADTEAPSDTQASQEESSPSDTEPQTTKVPPVTEAATTEPETEATEAPVETTVDPGEETTAPAPIDEDGSYYSKDEVALYIHTYGRLPRNFITKKEAGKLGWEGGPVDVYAEGCAIGGDRFGNREGILPTKKGRSYTECDIDTLGASSRGAKRIVFSNDGLIYYTDDHYETFTLLYGEE